MWCPLPYLVEQLRSLELGKWDKVGSGAMQLLSWSPECCRFGTQLREKKQLLLQSQHFCSRLGHSHRCYPSQLPEKCRKCSFPIKVGSVFLTEDQREWEMLGQLSPSPEMSRGANLLGSCSATRKVLFKSKRAQKLPGFWGRTCGFLSIPSHFMLCLMKLRLIFTRSAVPSRI